MFWPRRETEAAQEVFVEGKKEGGSFKQDLMERTWKSETGVEDMC